jgi:class 3 adenylate cyclase
MVSVFFTDIVGFTTLSDQLTPMQVSTMLDRFFSKLDSLIQELGLYKV